MQCARREDGVDSRPIRGGGCCTPLKTTQAACTPMKKSGRSCRWERAQVRDMSKKPTEMIWARI